jgi:hypothetical protein
MKNKKPNAELVWKQLEDVLVARLGLNLTERAVYAHLLRHSHIEGKRQLRFSIVWLARSVRLSDLARSPRRAQSRCQGGPARGGPKPSWPPGRSLAA